MIALTSRQGEVLAAINLYKERTGFQPTISNSSHDLKTEPRP